MKWEKNINKRVDEIINNPPTNSKLATLEELNWYERETGRKSIFLAKLVDEIPTPDEVVFIMRFKKELLKHHPYRDFASVLLDYQDKWEALNKQMLKDKDNGTK